MVNLESLRERWKTIDGLYHEHLGNTLALQSQVAGSLVTRLAAVEEQQQLGQAGLDRARAFADDPVTLFRFFRKAHFDPVTAAELIDKTLQWRLSTSIDLVSPSSLDPLYSGNPLFYFHPNLHDKFGRYAAVLNLAHVVRPEDNTLESLKEFIAYTLEVARRFLADMSKRDDSNTHVQIVIILNLEGANFSNFEVEMLPFVVDLLKNHFPGMIGAIYILNYGWAYAGMWQISKRVLPKAALERILFCSKEDMLTYFDKDHLLTEHGGEASYKYRFSSNYILTKYGRPSYFLRHRLSTPSQSAGPSPASSRPLSRISSMESMRDAFYSAAGTPRNMSAQSPSTSYTNLHGHKQKHPAWLDMTAAAADNTSLPRLHHANGLQLASPMMSPKQASFTSLQPSPASASSIRSSHDAYGQYSLEEKYYEYESDDSTPGDKEDNTWDQESFVSNESDNSGTVIASPGRQGRSSEGRSSPMTPYDQSRASSLARLRTALEANDVGSTPLERGRSSGTISPYNANNPFYGYPATRYLPGIPSSTVKLPHPRAYHVRRRKRDLIRTLSYLFALRILAFHRKIKFRLSLAWRIVWSFLLRWGAVSRRWVRRRQEDDLVDEDEDAGFSPKRRKRKGVHWAVDDGTAKRPVPTTIWSLLASPFTIIRSMPRWAIWLAALLFFRSKFFRIRARAAVTMVKEHGRTRLDRWRERAKRLEHG
ncbi:hypothetical protein P389DRAFT_198683 [Cystobasidium minutum MCA 4210]|uniref:uncharacterized protein n=1 Tax=Cystobasidium minutum MCA 4210 TaxID=1397322 RepID=UPI0034CDEB30|eukprot:jgi/Rhomi1/198683/gm1.6897_g